MALHVLVADSSQAVREGLELSLAGAGHEVFCAADGERAQALADASSPDVILWGLPEEQETRGLRAIAQRLPDAYLVAIRDGEDDAHREHAVQQGILDLLALPCSEPELQVLMQRADRWCRDRRELRLLRRDLERSFGDRPIVAASAAMIDVLETLERASSFRASVLLRGEHGTGKEGLARAIHSQSDRRRGPFVAVCCGGSLGASPEYEIPRGFVDADGGTLYLDEVDALPAPLQDELLAALECEEVTPAPGGKPRHVDVRIIAGTARDLRACAVAGEFHRDLLERLAGLEIAVPALRERRKDIPLLVDHFLARACRELSKPLRNLSDEALERLVDYAWPGNMRELENVVERAVILARGERVTGRELPEHLEAGEEARGGDLGLRRGRKRLEVEMIRRALRKTGGNRTHAARLLEISHRALLYKLKEYGI